MRRALICCADFPRRSGSVFCYRQRGRSSAYRIRRQSWCTGRGTGGHTSRLSVPRQSFPCCSLAPWRPDIQVPWTLVAALHAPRPAVTHRPIVDAAERLATAVSFPSRSLAFFITLDEVGALFLASFHRHRMCGTVWGIPSPAWLFTTGPMWLRILRNARLTRRVHRGA
jgi:hypothetical protein